MNDPSILDLRRAELNLDAIISCPICLETYSDPRVLVCGHSICIACVNKLAGKTKVDCPTCRTTTRIKKNSPLPINYTLRELIAFSRSQSGAKAVYTSSGGAIHQALKCASCEQKIHIAEFWSCGGCGKLALCDPCNSSQYQPSPEELIQIANGSTAPIRDNLIPTASSNVGRPGNLASDTVPRTSSDADTQTGPFIDSIPTRHKTATGTEDENAGAVFKHRVNPQLVPSAPIQDRRSVGSSIHHLQPRLTQVLEGQAQDRDSQENTVDEEYRVFITPPTRSHIPNTSADFTLSSARTVFDSCMKVAKRQREQWTQELSRKRQNLHENFLEQQDADIFVQFPSTPGSMLPKPEMR